MAAMAIGVNAETLIDFAQSQTIGIAVNGTTEISTVKIHENKDGVACIKFANSYTTEGAINDNYVTLTAEGGFKAGDVITIAGAFNNADDTKKSAVDIFTAEGTTPTVLFTTQQFINGQLPPQDITLKIRHTPEFLPARLEPTADGAYMVHADTPIHGVAPGQFCVIYDNRHHRCYGSGEITV